MHIHARITIAPQDLQTPRRARSTSAHRTPRRARPGKKVAGHKGEVDGFGVGWDAQLAVLLLGFG